jgi:hypothetical protein
VAQRADSEKTHPQYRKPTETEYSLNALSQNAVYGHSFRRKSMRESRERSIRSEGHFIRRSYEQ